MSSLHYLNLQNIQNWASLACEPLLYIHNCGKIQNILKISLKTLSSLHCLNFLNIRNWAVLWISPLLYIHNFEKIQNIQKIQSKPCQVCEWSQNSLKIGGAGQFPAKLCYNLYIMMNYAIFYTSKIFWKFTQKWVKTDNFRRFCVNFLKIRLILGAFVRIFV